MKLVEKSEVSPLSILSDEEFVVQAGARLRDIYLKKYGNGFTNGTLKFFFIGGKLLGIQKDTGQPLYVTSAGNLSSPQYQSEIA